MVFKGNLCKSVFCRDIFIILTFLLFYGGIQAKDLGVYGTTFEIKEKSLLEIVEEKLRVLQSSGQLEGHQKELQKRARLSVERPQGVGDLQKATSYQARHYNPSFILDKDIKDHEGNLIGKKGVAYNPLDYHSFGKPLLLVDGDDDSQVSWALSQEGKIVLTQGMPLQLAKTFGRHFYFDQGGVLTKKFGISKVPARISQKDRFLLIEETNPTGDR